MHFPSGPFHITNEQRSNNTQHLRDQTQERQLKQTVPVYDSHIVDSKSQCTGTCYEI